MEKMFKLSLVLFMLFISNIMVAQDVKEQTVTEHPKKSTSTKKAESKSEKVTDDTTVDAAEKKADKPKKNGAPSNMAISEQGTRKKEKPQSPANIVVQPDVIDAAKEVERGLDSIGAKEN